MNHQAFAQKMRDYSILYVEDDADVRAYIAQFLRRYCPGVYACESSEEAEKIYHRYHPDILLLDINLPGMSGLDFAAKIRLHDTKTRILISTAYTDKSFMLRAIELQLTRYLVKPMTSEELLAALQKSLQELQAESQVPLADGYTYDKKSTSILKGAQRVVLRRKEVQLLEFFLLHEGEVVRYELLENTLWPMDVMTRDAIRSQIRNLRRKMGINLIANISGIGYKFARKYTE